MRNSIKEIASCLRLMWRLDRTIVLTSLFASLIEAAVPFVGIILTSYVIDGLTSGVEMAKLITTAVCATLGVLVASIVKSWLTEQSEKHQYVCNDRFEALVTRRTLTMDFELLDSPYVNDVKARMQSDRSWGSGFLSMTYQLPRLISSAISVLIAIVILIPLLFQSGIGSSSAAIGILAGIVVIIVVNTVIGKRLREKIWSLLNGYSINSSYALYFAARGDYKFGKDIRIFGVKDLIKSYFDKDLPRDKTYIYPSARMMGASGFTGGLASGLMMTLSYLLVALRALSGAFGAGAAIRYAATIYRFASSVQIFAESFGDYSVAAKRQMSFIEYMNIADTRHKGTLPVEKRADNEYEIEFRDVSFKYPSSDIYALRDVNLKFTIGQRLAVVGMNGSGKTTLVKLLCRLYEPDEGVITLNGIDIRKYDYEEYMSVFSVVFQDFKLFAFDVGQNVAASADVDAPRAQTALEKSGFGERLSDMPRGLETPLYKNYDEDGVEISGGEAQKIALARALYKDAPFIVLDEPTAALDPIAEYEIYVKFNEIVGDKTAIFISHRLSSCRFCDEIVVFDEGRIIQRGTHAELLPDERGKYHALWHAQAQYYAEQPQ